MVAKEEVRALNSMQRRLSFLETEQLDREVTELRLVIFDDVVEVV